MNHFEFYLALVEYIKFEPQKMRFVKYWFKPN